MAPGSLACNRHSDHPASAAGMTVGLAVCALVIGLVLAMLFAVLESVKWRPVAWLATGIVTI
ncbi:hypothetical protein CKQ90_34425, partial [Klebsiella pneumoniae]